MWPAIQHFVGKPFSLSTSIHINVRFIVLVMVTKKITAFWDVTPWSQIDS
jgi:hypothetical protein